jgi:hypothetical protein
MTVSEVQERIYAGWFHTGADIPSRAPELCSFVDDGGNVVTVKGTAFEGSFRAVVTSADSQHHLGPYATATEAVAGIAAAIGASE